MWFLENIPHELGSNLVPYKKTLKFAAPTFRNRSLFIERALNTIASQHPIRSILNAGCAEGDLDPLLVHWGRVESVDISAEKIEMARTANQEVPANYRKQSIESLKYPESSFDVIVCTEVLEHVSSLQHSVEELYRVLKPGGFIIVTVPNQGFPISYDPINWLLLRFGIRPVSVGAYGYGHDKLISKEELAGALESTGFSLLQLHLLTGAIAGVWECYWIECLQALFKKCRKKRKKSGVSQMWIAPFIGFAESILRLDSLFTTSASVNLGVIARKKCGHFA